MKRLWLATTLVCLLATAGDDGDRWAGLFVAERNGTAIRVLFAQRNPTRDYQGAVIKFRTVGRKPGAWVVANKTPIYPRAVADIDWASLDPDPKEQARLRKKAAALIAKGDDHFIPAFATRDAMAAAAKDDKSWDQLFTTGYSWYYGAKDFDYALFYGNGCVIRNTNPKKGYEVAFFPVINGTVAAKPVRSFSLWHTKEEGTLPIEDIAARWSKRAKRINLNWEISDAYCTRFGFSSINGYRAEATRPGHFLRIGETFNSGGKHFVKNGRRWYGLGDRGAPPLSRDKTYIYKLMPKNHFFREMKMTYTFRCAIGKTGRGQIEVIGSNRLSDLSPLFGAYRHGKGCRVLFSCSVWPQGFTGFVVKRRERLAKAEWVTVTDKPLYPRTINEIDWKRLEPDPEKRRALTKKAEELVNNGTPSQKAFAKAEDLNALIGKTGNRHLLRRPYLWYWKTDDFDHLLIFGAGFIDRSCAADKNYRYGLFPVINGRTAASPVRTCLVPPKGFEDLEICEPKIEIEDDFVEITWHFKDAVCEDLGFTYVRVYRFPLGAPEQKKPVGDVAGIQEKGHCYFAFGDRKMDELQSGKTYVYRIVPITYLKQELKKTFDLKYVLPAK